MSTTKKTFRQMIGFSPKTAYPCDVYIDEKGHTQNREDDWGDFSFTAKKNTIIQEIIEFPNGGNCKIVNASIPFSSLTNDKHITNKANPRERVFESKRNDIVNTIENQPTLIAFTHGISIIVNEVEVKGNKINFKIEDTSRLIGIVDGQNLYAILLSFVQAYKEGKIESKYDLDNLTVPVHFYRLNNVTEDNIIQICKIKNFTIPQQNTALATLAGKFDQYIFDSIKDAIEIKPGKKAKTYEYPEDISNGEDTYMRNLIDIVHYFQFASLIHQGYEVKQMWEDTNQRIKGIMNNRSYSSRVKKDNEEGLKKSIMLQILLYARNTGVPAKTLLDGRKTDLPEFHIALNDETMKTFICNAYEEVFSTDYSNVPKEQMDILKFVPNKNNELTPLSKKKILYKIPFTSFVFIPVLFGGLCKEKEDPDTMETILVPPTDFAEFWKDSYEKIFAIMSAFRYGKYDSYCYTDDKNGKAYLMWYEIFDVMMKWRKKHKESKKDMKEAA